MKRASFLALGLTVSALAACAPMTPYVAPQIAAPASFGGDVAAKPVTAAWWTAFRDPVMTQMIDLGLAQNLDVKLAVARIKEAEADAGVAGSGDFPQLGVSATGGRSDPTGAGAVTAGSGTASVSWMLDLFGRNASAKAASRARLDAAYAGAGVARIAIAGAIAETYVDLRYYQNRIALTRQSRTSRQKTAELIQSTFAAGAATKLDTLRAEQLIAIADAQLPSLEVGYARAINRLATLTGQPVSSLEATLTKGAAQPVPRFRASVGVPAEVLRQRPDIIAAERNYAAAVAMVGVAKADLFPSLVLGGTVTASGVQGGASATTWSFGPALNLPIFSGGRVKANLSAAESRAQQAHLGWQAAVLNAVEEIRNALAAYARDGRNMAAQEKLMDISQQTLDLARSSFEIGEGDFLSVLEAERTLLDARGALSEASRARALNFIRLGVATAGATPLN